MMVHLLWGGRTACGQRVRPGMLTSEHLVSVTCQRCRETRRFKLAEGRLTTGEKWSFTQSAPVLVPEPAYDYVRYYLEATHEFRRLNLIHRNLGPVSHEEMEEASQDVVRTFKDLLHYVQTDPFWKED